MCSGVLLQPGAHSCCRSAHCSHVQPGSALPWSHEALHTAVRSCGWTHGSVNGTAGPGGSSPQPAAAAAPRRSRARRGGRDAGLQAPWQISAVMERYVCGHASLESGGSLLAAAARGPTGAALRIAPAMPSPANPVGGGTRNRRGSPLARGVLAGGGGASCPRCPRTKPRSWPALPPFTHSQTASQAFAHRQPAPHTQAWRPPPPAPAGSSLCCCCWQSFAPSEWRLCCPVDSRR